MRRNPGAVEVLIGIPVLLVGGTEVHTLTLVRALTDAGMRVTVCCYYDYATSMRVAVKEAGAQLSMLGLRRSDGLLKLFIRLRALYRELRPDVVHVQYIAPGLVPILAARAAGVPTVFATVHQPGDRFGRREKTMLRSAARLCTAFFCVSKTAEESWFGDSAIFDTLLATQGRRHFTIYNGVAVSSDVQPTASANKDLKRSLGFPDKRVIGIVGRLSKEKGHAFLLDALPLVAAAVPELGVLVVGDGPEREGLLQRAKQLRIESRIVWMGECPNTEVQQLYGAMDVIAVPSAFEGFGLSAAEAMSAGRPVVGTAVGGLREIVDDGRTGRLVEFGNTELLAQALIELLKDADLAREMGARGRLRVSERFSAARFSRETVEAYRHFRRDANVGRTG